MLRSTPDNRVGFFPIAGESLMKFFSNIRRALYKISVSFSEFKERFLRAITIHYDKRNILFVV